MKKERILGTKRWIYWVSIGTILIIIYKFLDNFSGIGAWIGNLFAILAPFVIAMLLAYILYKPCNILEQIFKINKMKKGARPLSIAIVYTIAFVILYFILKFIIPAIVGSIVDLITNAQNYYNSIQTNEVHSSWAPYIDEYVLKPLVDYIQNMDFKAMVTPEKIVNYVVSAIGVAKVILNIFISIICSVYILNEREKLVKAINKFAKAVMTSAGYKRFNRYFTNGNRIFFDFISSQVVDGIIVAFTMSVILVILGVKYGVTLGILIGIFNLIPYFGAIIAVVVAALITILTGGWQQALCMTIIVIIAQQIDANIINPRITGSKLQVSPLLVIFAVTVGGAYFGIFGMFIAVPTAVLIKLMLVDYIHSKNEEKKKEKIANK